MGSQTPNLALPYPVGTDRVMDGDDAIKAAMERIEARMPWGVLAALERTSSSTAVQNTKIAGLSSVTLPGGRRVRLIATFPWYIVGTGGQVECVLKQDGANIARAYFTAANGAVGSFYIHRTLVPAAGAHLYELWAGNPTIQYTVNAEAVSPLQMLLEDVGPGTI